MAEIVSLRAIAGATGVSENQVRKDIAAEELRTGAQLSPGRITGLDGKTYPAKRPPPSGRAGCASLPFAHPRIEELDADTFAFSEVGTDATRQ